MNVRKSSLTCSRLFSVFVSALALGSLCAGTQESRTNSAELSDRDWASVRSVYEAGKHAAYSTEDGWQAHNPGQGWQLRFDERSFLVKPDASDWSWGLELVSYGFDGNERFASQSACTSADAGRVTYEWDDTLEEWFINDTRGLEHGFTVRKRPGQDAEGPLVLKLRVLGQLEANVSGDGRDVAFVNKNGATILNYNGLTVFDADGQALLASFEASAGELILSVSESGARYPLTIDPVAYESYLKASNTGSGDGFGSGIAIDGNTLVVGAWQEDSGATGVDGNQGSNTASNSGAAYVFVRNGMAWTQQAYLKASNTTASAEFGESVAISGNTIVIGARGDGATGTAYVFTRNGAIWSQQALLKAPVLGLNDFFGFDVDISGDTLVVGARGEDSDAMGLDGAQASNAAPDSGAAYIFNRAGTSWSIQAYVKASNTGVNDQFGAAVGISGDSVIIGAPGEASSATGINGNQFINNSTSAGASYIFTRSGTTWSQQAYVKASNAEAGDLFGTSVDLSGDLAVVGAWLEDSGSTGIDGNQTNNGALFAGSAYAFSRTGSSWSQDAYLKASNTETLDGFGYSVAISGTTIVVGAIGECSNATGINGNEANNNAVSSGAAYLFTRTGFGWNQVAFMKASNTDGDDIFGVAVDLSLTSVAVGAMRESSSSFGVEGDQTNNNAVNAGAAYAFGFASIAVDDLCSGDGGNLMGCTNCPCGNDSPPGTRGGCINSSGDSARLSVDGDLSVSLPPNTLTDLGFYLSGVPPLSFSILNSGDALAPGNMANPCFSEGSGVQSINFDGLRCAIQNTRRHGGRSADLFGEIGVSNAPWGGKGGPPLGLAQAGGGFAAGQTRYFQVIHRDEPLAVCTRGLNTSQAVRVTFTP